MVATVAKARTCVVSRARGAGGGGVLEREGVL